MWAKLHGYYERIVEGFEFETIRDLTGAPGYFSQQIDEDTFDKIYEYDQAGYVMSCAMRPGYDPELATKQGLVPGHAYTLISAHKFTDAEGDVIKLIKLRNPWGSGEWNGDWSDNSTCWTDELKKQFNLTTADDGVFYMDIWDFKETFGVWNVNKIMDNAYFNYRKIESPYKTKSEFRDRYKNPKYHLMRMRINKPGMHTIAISQFGNRLLPLKAKYLYANVVCYLVKEQTENSFKGSKLIYGKRSIQQRDIYIEIPNAEVGFYWLYVDVEW